MTAVLVVLITAVGAALFFYLRNRKLKDQLRQSIVAENTARHSAERYRAIANHANSWEYWIDRDGKLAWVNPAVEHISGYTPDECYAMREYPLALIHADDLERLNHYFERAIRGESGENIEFRLLHKNGQVRWCSMSWQGVIDANGKPFGHRASVWDITEIKSRVTALSHTGQMLQLVLDHIPQRIFWKDREGKYLGANRAYTHALGLDEPEKILGLTAFDFHTRERAVISRTDDTTIMQSGLPRIDREDAIHLPDGGIRWEMRSKAPLINMNGDIVGILGLYEDITKFKQTEMAALENELRLRVALSASKQALYEINLTSNVITFSPEFAMLTDDQEVSEAFPISQLFEKFHPDDRNQVEDTFHAYLGGELPIFRCEARLETVAGNWKWVLLLGAVVSRDLQGTPIKMLGTVTDITDVKRLADQVQENVQRLRDITDTLEEGLLVQDAQGRITFANPEAVALLGWEQRELVGGSAYEKIHCCKPDGSPFPVEQCHIQVAIRTGKSYGGEVFFQHRDGMMIPVSVSVAPFRKNSRVTESVIAFRCIGEQLKTQQKLKETLRELGIILNTVQTGICFVKDRKFVWINRHMKETFGYQIKEIRNKSTRLVYPDDASFEAMGQSAYPLLTQGLTFEQECRLRRKNGETFWCHLRGAAINPEDPSAGSIWVVVNIDHLKKTEQELQELNLSLEEKIAEETRKNLEQERLLTHQARHAAMGEMIGNIAHQWRQPLNTLGLLVQNIDFDYQEGYLTQEALTEYKNTALQTVRKMSQTIDDFRNFFQPNRVEKSFNLIHPIQEAMNLLAASLKNNAISVTIECPENLAAFGLPNEFAQAMLNFLANAKDVLVEKDIPDKKIEISARDEGEYVVVCVGDNGGGIPAEIMDKMFDPYFTTKKNGTGIGLYMTRMIIEQHMHGIIRFRNTEVGAEFSLALPREKIHVGGLRH